MTDALKKHAMWIVLLAAAGTFALTMGVRQTMGLFLADVNTSTGLGIANISLAFAYGQLWWGLTQPFAGAAADRLGAGRVLFIGVCLVALGTIMTPLMTTTIGLIFAIGILAAGGAGMAGPSVLMAATTRLLPPEKRGMATGIVNAGGSFGQFLMAPIAAGLTAMSGWMTSMQILGFIVLLALPAAWVLKGNSNAVAQPASTASAPPAAREGTGAAIKRALSDSSYLMLGAGFFVCGFHVAFLGTHLPNVVAMCGLPPSISAWSLAVLGLFNIVGSLLMGWAVGRWRMKSLLSLVYAARAVGVALFLVSPKTATVMLIFAAFMGLTYLSTVPPTAGLVAKFFGTANMATLFGLVLFSHQIGGFLGAWLGGKVFTATGSYDTIWIIDILLAIGAALVHLPIKEAKLALKPRAA
ncbi:MAG: MFS transporter [Burkholderiales bacterium]|nr:MFS transporter [Burkholderiales bacterium]